MAVVAVSVSSGVALLGTGAQLAVAFLDRRQTRRDKRADRIWEAKAEALQSAAVLVTRLNGALRSEGRSHKRERVMDAHKIMDKMGTESAAQILVYASADVRDAYRCLVDLLDSARLPLEFKMRNVRAHDSKIEAIDAGKFAEAAQHRAAELKAITDGGLPEKRAEEVVRAALVSLEELSSAVRADAANSDVHRA